MAYSRLAGRRTIYQTLSLWALLPLLLLLGCQSGLVATSPPPPASPAVSGGTAVRRTATATFATPAAATPARPTATTTVAAQPCLTRSTPATPRFIPTLRPTSFSPRLFATAPCPDQAQAPPLHFSPNNRWIAAGGTSAAALYESSTALLQWTLPTTQSVVGLTFTPDNQMLIVALASGALLLCHTADGQVLRQVPDGRPAPFTSQPIGRLPLAVSNAGRWLVAGYAEALVLWDLHEAADKSPTTLPVAQTTAITFVADDQVLWVVAADRRDTPNPNALSTLYRWTTTDWQEQIWLLPDVARLPPLLTATTLTLVTLADELVLWDLATTPEPARQITFARSPTALAVSADGLSILSGTAAGIDLWERSTLWRPLSYPGTAHPLVALALSPNGQLLAAVDQAGVLATWLRYGT